MKHYLDYSTRHDDKRKKESFTKDELDIIISVYRDLREKFGFYPEGVGEDQFGDKVMRWGVVLKSDIDMLMEKKGDEFERMGNEIRRNGLESIVNDFSDYY